MPARSKSQQRLFGMALEAKREGKTPPAGLGKLSAKTIKEFAATPTKGLPTVKAPKKPKK